MCLLMAGFARGAVNVLPVDDKRGFATKSRDLDVRESSVEGRACTYARNLGYWHRKYKSPGKRSAPDRIFKHLHGIAFFIEFKARGKEPTALQLAEHAEMRAAGLIVYVCDNFDDAKAILDRHCL
jgi:hypothetical protein